MRCHICDFSSNNLSPFYQGLSLSYSRQNRVVLDEVTGEFICTGCLENSRSWSEAAIEGETELLDESMD